MPQLVPSLFGEQAYLTWPNHLIGWMGWLALFFAFGWGLWKSRANLADQARRGWIWLLVLFLLTIPASAFLGLRLPGETLPIPAMPVETGAPVLMLLAAIPWVLASGLVGPVPGALLAFLSGFILALFETHNPFTPFEMGLLALVFAFAIRQRYRTLFYRILRHPLAAALLVGIIFFPVLIGSAIFSTNGSLAARLDYAFTQSWMLLLKAAGGLLLAGLAGELFYLFLPKAWGSQAALRPSPSESSLQTRFFLYTAPLVIVLVMALVIGDWLVAGNAARRMVEERLSSTAQVAADSLPYFLETGENLALTLATPDMMSGSTPAQTEKLGERIRSVPYFRQLYLFDANGALVAGYPEQDLNQSPPTQEETMGIKLAIKGISVQHYIVPPLPGESSVQVSFIAAIRNEQGEAQGALLGRTDFNSNPFVQPAIQALKGIGDLGGEGIILSETGMILYDPNASQVMSNYLGNRPASASFFNEISPNNTRRYVYYQPVSGRPWAVVLAAPAQLAQQMALDIAVPLLVLLLAMSALAYIFLRFGLSSLTSSLRALALEASAISLGNLDHPLQEKGVDEVGQLSAAFEQMRARLKARLEELRELLSVSQGVASNLEIGDSIIPILEAAMTNGASSARMVLVKDVTLDTSEKGPVSFGIGPAAQAYAAYDEQLFELARQQDLINLPSLTRSRRIVVEAGQPSPAALLGMPVRQENRYYGVFWVGYDRARTFTDEEIRFLTTLSSEAALAATSARLYATAEVGRQRLEAVLASTPEPVLVIDEARRLLLLNPAAVQVPGLILTPIEGQPVEDVVGPKEVLGLLTMPLSERISSREITLPNGKVYYGSVASVMVEGRALGRVCILRDITHYKELELMKSDFVATVSHDLRSPLTLVRGYATMLQMVGELNEQQKGYVQKILVGVENMTSLVTHLLDLGRIEAGIGLQIERVPLNEVVDEVMNALQLQAAQKDIRLSKEVNERGRGLTMEADRALIQQAMVNLVENAIKYTPVGGQVKLKLEARPNTFLFAVQDTGIGVAPLDQPHLFEKFYRSGRREAYQQRGTGLGLAIVKSIVERHGGHVWVDSQLGKGSVFSLEVPCEQAKK